jgi:hypothetical protein
MSNPPSPASGKSADGEVSRAKNGGRGENLDGALNDARIILHFVKRALDPNRGIEAYETDAFFKVASTHFDPASAADILDAAERGDPVARSAIHHAVAWYLINRVALPDTLRDYLVKLLVFQGGIGTKKKPPHKNYLRDDWIRIAVRAVKAHGFERTRNPATESPSACSIVRQVLEEYGIAMSEKTVEAITDPLKPRKRPEKHRGVV